MPHEVLFQFTCDPAISGKPIGSTALVYSVDSDEYLKLKMGIVLDEHPPPRSWLLDKYGEVDPGVLAGSQTKMSEQEKKNEQQFLLDQVRDADRKHAEQLEQKRLADAVSSKRKEVSRG